MVAETVSFRQRVADFIRGPRPPEPGTQGALVDTDSNPNTDLDHYKTDLQLQYLLPIGADLTPADIRSYRTRARVGDARYLYGVYDEMIRLGPGPQVSKMIEAIRNTEDQYKTTPEDLDPDEDNPDEGVDLGIDPDVARDARDYIETVVSPWASEIKAHMATAELYGIAAGEIVTDTRGITWNGEQRERIVDFRPIPARRFRLDPVSHEWLLCLSPLSMEGVPVGPLVERGKLLFYEIGKDTEPLDQRGLFFQCLAPWAIMNYCVRWRARRVEFYGVPPRMGFVNLNDAKQKMEMQQSLANFGAASYGVFSKEAKVEFANALAQGRIDPQAEQIDWCDRRFDLIILGDTQASQVQVGAGSRTSKQEAVGASKELTNSRALRLATAVFNRQLIPGLCLRNLGREITANACPTMESAIVEPEDSDALAGTALKLSQGGFGNRIDGDDLVRRCSFQVAETPEQGAVLPTQPMPASEADQDVAAPADAGAVPIPGKLLPKPTKKSAQPLRRPTKKAPLATRKFMAIGDFQPPTDAPVLIAPAGTKPRISITSFGYGNGKIPAAHARYDARALTARVSAIRERTGRDPEVANAIADDPKTDPWYYGALGDALGRVGRATAAGTPDLNLAVGCMHGRHRSVYVAERMGKDLRRMSHDVTVTHRDADDPALTASRLPGAPVETDEPASRLLMSTAPEVAAPVPFGFVLPVPHRTEKFYSPDQERVPAGGPDGGEFAGPGAGGEKKFFVPTPPSSTPEQKEEARKLEEALAKFKFEPPVPGISGYQLIPSVGGHNFAYNSNLLADKIFSEGGFTYNPITGKEPGSGFVVSIHPELETILDAKNVHGKEIRDFVYKNQYLLESDEKSHVGGWLDRVTGKVYLDVSRIEKTAEDARRLAIQFHQKAFYDLEKKSTVRLSEVHPHRAFYEDKSTPGPQLKPPLGFGAEEVREVRLPEGNERGRDGEAHPGDGPEEVGQLFYSEDEPRD